MAKQNVKSKNRKRVGMPPIGGWKKVKKKVAKKRKIKTKKNPKRFSSESVKVFVLRDQKTGQYYTSNFTNTLGPLEEAEVYPSKANVENCQADYSDIIPATLTTKG